MLRLFWVLGSCAMASHIALEESGAEYETARIDFKQGDQSWPDYLKVNPKGPVPERITDRGTLTETPSILAWIAQSYPQSKLAPTDPFEFAVARAFNSYLRSTVYPAHAHGSRWSDDAAAQEMMKVKVPQKLIDCFTLIEKDMLKGTMGAGASPTAFVTRTSIPSAAGSRATRSISRNFPKRTIISSA